jgi:hypothetical protein
MAKDMRGPAEGGHRPMGGRGDLEWFAAQSRAAGRGMR